MIDLHNESGRRWTTAALTGIALLSAAYWGEAALLKFRQGLPEAALQSGSAASGASLTGPVVTPPAESLARLLGAQARPQAAPAGPAERFKVMGVIASATGQGAALIAVDGQPPRAYKVGAELAPGFVLSSVSQKELKLAASQGGDVLATLALPEPGSAPGAAATAGGNPGVPPGFEGRGSGPPAVSGSRGDPRNVGPAVPAAPLTAPVNPGTGAGTAAPASLAPP